MDHSTWFSEEQRLFGPVCVLNRETDHSHFHPWSSHIPISKARLIWGLCKWIRCLFKSVCTCHDSKFPGWEDFRCVLRSRLKYRWDKVLISWIHVNTDPLHTNFIITLPQFEMTKIVWIVIKKLQVVFTVSHADFVQKVAAHSHLAES